jgi:hypothetical protein
MPERTPPVVEDLAASCARFVKRANGFDLDYTPETLPLLDHYVRELGDDTAEEVLGLVVPAVGAYFGEVVKRAFEDGRWRSESDDYDTWELSFARCSMRFNPIAIAYELVTRGKDGFRAPLELAPADRGRAAEILESLGEVREEDYYLFAIRFEALTDLYANLSGVEPGARPN